MSKPTAFAVDRSRTIISSLIHGRKVTSLDILWLRREVFAGREVTREDAEELFAVARANVPKAPEWTQLFVELVTKHVLPQARSPGALGEAQARWLIERVDEAASVEALAALANVLAEARSVPEWLVAEARARARRWPGLGGSLAGASARPPRAEAAKLSALDAAHALP